MGIYQFISAASAGVDFTFCGGGKTRAPIFRQKSLDTVLIFDYNVRTNGAVSNGIRTIYIGFGMSRSYNTGFTRYGALSLGGACGAADMRRCSATY